MQRAQLQTILSTWGVTPPDLNRAGLYYNQLDQVRTFLFGLTTDPVIGPVYARFMDALQDPLLLDDFCEILDGFVAQGVNHYLRNPLGAYTTYDNFFDQFVFNAAPATYQANITAFDNAYPATHRAVVALTNNFQNNVQQACQRVQTDWGDIQRTFAPRGATLTRLTRIESTGSDFHKGGTQVLILTFACDTVILMGLVTNPLESSVKVVYKPSDLEVDCLLAGNSAAVNAIHAGFQNESLAEIINGIIAANPNHLDGLVPLPTYKIIPYDYGTILAALPGGRVPVRNSYGYLEFLEHAHAPGLNIFNYYPFGASDYKIFPSQDAVAIATTFYRQMGQWLALACSFSIIDMHVENIRVRAYQGQLIDLEVCLVGPIADADRTGMFQHNLGGITGSQAQEPRTYTVVGGNGALRLDEQRRLEYRSNRLWTVDPDLLVNPSAATPARSFLQGVKNGLELISAGVRQVTNVFDAWFDRLFQGHGAIVRYLPYGTRDFLGIRDAIYRWNHANDAGYINNAIMIYLTDEYYRYRDQATPEPDFLAVQPAYVTNDYNNCDIPVFYHRIRSTEIMDSDGNQVQVTDTVTVNNRNPPPLTVVVATNVGRDIFFANPPTPIVQATQVNALSTVPNVVARLAMLRPTVLAGLGLNATPPIGTVIH